MKEKINLDYLNLYKEIVLLIVLSIRRFFFRPIPSEDTKKTLIVITCLIGEFAATLPALRDFIEAYPDRKVDLVVSPGVKILAEHVIGVGEIFTATSVYKRENEQIESPDLSFGMYEEVIVLRISRAAYQLLTQIHTRVLRTSLWPLLNYGTHLVVSMIRRRTPDRWSDVNSKVLRRPARIIPIGNVLSFAQTDLDRVKNLSGMNSKGQKIIIHTGGSWIMNRWSNQKWIELLTRLHEVYAPTFIFVGSSKIDEENYHEISAKLSFPTVSLIRQIELIDLVLVLCGADCFIGIDSGPRNLAHLVDLPSIVLLGPGPHMFTPMNSRNILLDHSNGRGLLERFYQRQKDGYLEKITPAEVFEAYVRLLELSKTTT